MQQHLHNLYLIGPMGSGKTTIGRAIATRTGLHFFDSDQEIIQQSGVEIDWIFETEGEAGFRQREHFALKALVEKTGIVLATGGGCVTYTENRALLQAHGFVVYLRVTLEKQLSRLRKHKNKRPLFDANATEERLAKMNEMRAPLYESIANFSCDTDLETPHNTAKKIIIAWQESGGRA